MSSIKTTEIKLFFFINGIYLKFLHVTKWQTIYFSFVFIFTTIIKIIISFESSLPNAKLFSSCEKTVIMLLLLLCCCCSDVLCVWTTLNNLFETLKLWNWAINLVVFVLVFMFVVLLLLLFVCQNGYTN